jgi:4-carboxymuconolactone decarboxylase
MARIPYFDPTRGVGPRAKQTLERLPAWNVFRMAGHMGELLQGFAKLGNQILNYTKIDPVLREIAIIRVGVLSKAPYEISKHEEIGRQVGMTDALVAAVHVGADAEAFDDLQRLVLRFTDEVVLNVRPSDATFKPLEAVLSHQEMAELVVTIGYYMMVSRFVEAFDVEMDP